MKADLHSLRGLSWLIGVPLEALRRLSIDTDARYRPFEKVRPGKKARTIDNPLEQLKAVQRRIRSELLADRPLDPSVRACVKGGSPYKNADVHRGQHSLAHVDVKNCYPSITHKMVFRLFRAQGFGPKVAGLLTRLSTRLYHLPQGAPTSDMLANLYLDQVDRKVVEIAKSHGLRNSRCMDDIAVSGGPHTHGAITEIVAAIRAAGLAVRHKKTGNAGATKAHELTGFVVNGNHGPKVPKRKIQQICVDAFRIIDAHARGESVDSAMNSMRGSLRYLGRTNGGAAARIARRLNRAGIRV